MEGDREGDLPDWALVVNEVFSEDVVYKAIKRWLRDRRYEFEVRMIPFEKARGSGLVRRLKQMDIEPENGDAVPMEEVMKELSEQESKRMAGVIEQRRDKKKIFYYQGLYGSLVPEVDSDRLIGKIEGIKGNIIYKGKTVKECEQKFREAVSKYKKGEAI